MIKQESLQKRNELDNVRLYYRKNFVYILLNIYT